MAYMISNPSPYTIINTTTGTITTTGSGNISIGTTTAPYTTMTSDYWFPKKELEKLPYVVSFEVDKNDLLKNKVRGIRKNKFIFSCDIKNNRIQPYEFIMSLIEEKREFTVRVKISDILTLVYEKFRFVEIQNNFDFDQDNGCDFSKLKVRFKFDKILYENNKLSTKQKRVDKINKINKKYEGDSN